MHERAREGAVKNKAKKKHDGKALRDCVKFGMGLVVVPGSGISVADIEAAAQWLRQRLRWGSVVRLREVRNGTGCSRFDGPGQIMQERAGEGAGEEQGRD